MRKMVEMHACDQCGAIIETDVCHSIRVMTHSTTYSASDTIKEFCAECFVKLSVDLEFLINNFSEEDDEDEMKQCNTRKLRDTIQAVDIETSISNLDCYEVNQTLSNILRADDLEDFEKIQEELAAEVMHSNTELEAAETEKAIINEQRMKA